MIIFFSSFDVILVAILLLALLVGAIETVMKLIWIFIIFCCIVVIVNDIVFGLFKKHNSCILTIIYLIIDSIRVFLFSNMVLNYIDAYNKSGGLSMFSRLFDFVIVLFIGGAIYSIGEIISIGHATDNDVSPKSIIVMDLIWLIILGAFYWWVMSYN